MKIICDIFKSPKDDEMYLYVKKAEALTRVPEALLGMFGKPRHVVTMLLQPEKKLARADISKVMEQLEVNGYYLQMPPPKDPEMQAVHLQNSKINLK
jgi:uncharacterized protein YcgL (UPF0745 family)